MNDLSWFLYLADVLPNISSSLGIFSFFGLLGFGILTVLLFIGVTIDPVKGLKPVYWKWSLFFFFVMPVLGLVAALIPSKETFYLIAGSQIGEQVVTSEPARELMSDIHQVIKQQLDNLKK